MMGFKKHNLLFYFHYQLQSPFPLSRLKLRSSKCAVLCSCWRPLPWRPPWGRTRSDNDQLKSEVSYNKGKYTCCDGHFIWEEIKIELFSTRDSHQNYFTINDDSSLLMIILTLRTPQGRDSRHYWGQNMTVPRSFKNMGSINVAG